MVIIEKSMDGISWARSTEVSDMLDWANSLQVYPLVKMDVRFPLTALTVVMLKLTLFARCFPQSPASPFAPRPTLVGVWVCGPHQLRILRIHPSPSWTMLCWSFSLAPIPGPLSTGSCGPTSSLAMQLTTA